MLADLDVPSKPKQIVGNSGDVVPSSSGCLLDRDETNEVIETEDFIEDAPDKVQVLVPDLNKD
jgi:hypothetical protein